MTGFGLVVAAAGLIAFLVTLLVFSNAQRLGTIQRPNQRSSHTIPTATGGGVGIVAGGTLAGLPMVYGTPWPTLLVLAASLTIAAIGFLDDRISLRIRTRLLAQVVVAALVTIAIPLDILGAQLGLPLPEPLLAALLICAGVSWINIFNFMDGIDGLAALQAIFMLLAAALLSAHGATDQPVYWWMIALAAATIGFAVLNWPPARIFMGDAGSTYLGLMTGFFALATIAGGWLSHWQWLILGAVFLSDGFATIIRRALQREPVWQPHRRHAYQFLQRRLGSHAYVTLLYLAINLCWLLPLAWWAGVLGQGGWMATLLAYAVLVPAVLLAGAGRPWQLERDQQKL